MRRVSPLLFIAAFDYAPYPGTAGLRFLLSQFCPVLACTHGDSPFHPSICDLSLPASLHWHNRGSVSVSEPELSPYAISASVCPVVEGLSSRLVVAAAALPLSIIAWSLDGIICCHRGQQRWGLLPHIYNILKHKVRTRAPDELPAPDNGMKE